MNVVAMQTPVISLRQYSIEEVIDQALTSLTEGSVVAVASKIVSLCQGRVARLEVDKDKLVQDEAEQYLDASRNKYHFALTIKHNILIPNAGIDQSNADGHYVLWPEDPQGSANLIRSFIQQRFKVTKVGVIITDSTTSPLQWGVTGIAIAHSGFAALNDRRGTNDLFGRKLEVTQSNVSQALAAAAVVVMGESTEQTPLAIITDLPFVEFQDRDPTEQELQHLHIRLEDDLYYPLLQSAPWQKTTSSSSHTGK